MNAFRVMTFNVGGCRGLDGRVSVERIAAAIKAGQPDIVALQEVEAGLPQNQLAILSKQLHMDCFGKNWHRGNAFLSRFPLRALQEYDLGGGGVCLRADVDIQGKRLHLFNIRLQVFPFPRRRQIANLLGNELLGDANLVCPQLLLGDFADPWFGLGTLELLFSLRVSSPSSWLPTFPSRFPLFSRDRAYYKGDISVLDSRVLNDPETRLASSHLPLLITLKVTDSLEYLQAEKIRNSRMETAAGCFRNRI